jgi:hypothetical protein
VSSVDGTWNATINSPMGAQEAVFTFATDGSSPTGTATQNGATTDLSEVLLDGDQLAFGLSVTVPMPLELQFALTVDGDSLNGTAQAGPFPPMPVSGERA